MARNRNRVNPDRLNTPGPRRRPLFPELKMDSERFGRLAEAFARYMGTAQFIAWMTVFVFVWVLLNSVAFVAHWDPYPFILLNLFFSTQASYAAPLILLAQNRQEARDRVMVEEDRRTAAQSRADMDFLAREIASLRMRMGEVATRDFIRAELRDLLEELDHRADEAELADLAERAVVEPPAPAPPEDDAG